METNKLNNRQRLKFEYRITLSYLLFGLMWILFSDKFLDLLISDIDLLTEFQTYKGAFFVVVTAAFLYLFAQRHMLNLRKAETKIIESERHYKSLFDDNHSTILLLNPENGKIEDANPAACRYYNCSHTELCSKSIYDFYTFGTQPAIHIELSLPEGKTFSLGFVLSEVWDVSVDVFFM